MVCNCECIHKIKNILLPFGNLLNILRYEKSFTTVTNRGRSKTFIMKIFRVISWYEFCVIFVKS